MSGPGVSGPGRPLPRLDDANRPHWEAARRGVLLLQRCLDCGVWRYPAARHCVACHGTRAEWAAASGRGTVHSMCVFHKGYFPGLTPPYNVVVVALDEGVRLYSNLIGLADEDIRIGMPVEAVFEPATDEAGLVKFRAAGDAR